MKTFSKSISIMLIFLMIFLICGCNKTEEKPATDSTSDGVCEVDEDSGIKDTGNITTSDEKDSDETNSGKTNSDQNEGKNSGKIISNDDDNNNNNNNAGKDNDDGKSQNNADNKSDKGSKGKTEFVRVTGLTGGTEQYNTLVVGQALVLPYKILPENATIKNIIWKVDSSLAPTDFMEAKGKISIDNNGVVTGIATGDTAVRAFTEDGNYCTIYLIRVVYPSYVKGEPLKYTYTVENGNATITGFAKYSQYIYDIVPSELSIPSKIDGYPVVAIGDNAFEKIANVNIISFPEGLIKIGDCAFNYADHLYQVKFPSTLKEIGDGAFANCHYFTDLVIPDNVTTIGGYAFGGCAFLTHIKLPSGLTQISGSLFDGCCNLNSLEVGNKFTKIGSYAFKNCVNLTDFVIPDTVTIIDDYAFGSCGIKSVVIPDSVTELGDYSFNYCQLDNMKIGKGLKTIGYGVLSNAFIKNITFSGNITSIDNQLVSGAYFTTAVIFEPGVEKIDFSQVSLTGSAYLYIPDSVSNIKLNNEYGTICANKGSYAEQYANEHGYHFIPN